MFFTLMRKSKSAQFDTRDHCNFNNQRNTNVNYNEEDEEISKFLVKKQKIPFNRRIT